MDPEVVVCVPQLVSVGGYSQHLLYWSEVIVEENADTLGQ